MVKSALKVQVYTHRYFSGDPSIESIQLDFKAYKEVGIAPPYFGRDAAYHYPTLCKEEEVHHLHLYNWPPTSQSRRDYSSKKQYYRTSDKHLVYCPGFRHRNRFLLIAVLQPNAHKLANDTDCMLDIGRIAEAFRREN